VKGFRRWLAGKIAPKPDRINGQQFALSFAGGMAFVDDLVKRLRIEIEKGKPESEG
jgi:hypothetical protein